VSERATADLIRALARDLAPVRRIAPLPAVVLAALAVWLLGLAVEWLLGGPGLRPRGGAGMHAGYYVAALVGLALVALCAPAAAQASVVPGRLTAARGFAIVAAAGWLLAALAAAGAIASHGTADFAREALGSLGCVRRALLLGTVPALVTAAFVGHSAVRRPGMAAALALAGGIGLAAWSVHLSCPSDSPVHQLLGHTLVPLAAAALAGAPVALLLGRWVRWRLQPGG
jgi:hypothetical protein